MLPCSYIFFNTGNKVQYVQAARRSCRCPPLLKIYLCKVQSCSLLQEELSAKPPDCCGRSVWAQCLGGSGCSRIPPLWGPQKAALARGVALHGCAKMVFRPIRCFWRAVITLASDVCARREERFQSSRVANFPFFSLEFEWPKLLNIV